MCRNQLHPNLGSGSLSRAPDAHAGHLAAMMPRDIWRGETAEIAAHWNDGRCCGLSRVGSVGCSEIGVEAPRARRSRRVT